MPVSVWAIIGDGDTRKSSTSRALTGAWRETMRWDMQFSNGRYPTYVHPRALQESKVSPELFVAKVRSADVNTVIIALRYNRACGQPPAARYLDYFRTCGWQICGHAILGSHPQIPLSGVPVSVPDAPNIPSNEIARQLRAAWGVG